MCASVSVTRTVCGGCLDFKVATKMTAETFDDAKPLAELEAAFLEELKAAGGTDVETQTFTLEEL